MATSEHVIMQNEALVALGLMAGLDLGENRLSFCSLPLAVVRGQRSEVSSAGLSASAEQDFAGASLVSVLHKLLSEEKSAPEIKYNSMILLCAVMASG